MSSPTTSDDASSRVVNFVWSYADLLSGGLHSCQTWEDESCRAGSAGVRAFLRNNTLPGEESLIVSRVDYMSAFVQMHPLEWGVNRLILNDFYGSETFFVYKSFASQHIVDSPNSQQDLSNLQTQHFRPLVANFIVSTTNSWFSYLKHIHFDKSTGLAVFSITYGGDDLETASNGTIAQVQQIDHAQGILRFISQVNEENGCNGPGGEPHYQKYLSEVYPALLTATNTSSTPATCWTPVVVYEAGVEFFDFLEEITLFEYPPAVIIDVRDNGKGVYNEPTTYNGVFVVSYFNLYKHFYQNRITIQNGRVTDLELVFQPMDTIPPEVKDETFRRDISFLRQLADEAAANDPIEGSSELMPVVMDFSTNLRWCMGGECPMGNLFTDAMRWKVDADWAFINSGGIRGPGWKAGPVRVSDIWATLPFPNSICTGYTSGVSIFRIMDYSLSMASLETEWTRNGDRLLQVSGLRVTYNTNLEGEHKLVDLHIWNDEANDYIPVDRLQIYKFATSSWECTGMDPLPSFLNEMLSPEDNVLGEQPAVVYADLLQTIVGEFLGEFDENKPYVPSVEGRLVNNTESMVPLDWIQTEESCAAATYWVERYKTCFDCPKTDKVVFTDRLAEFEGRSGENKSFAGRATIVNGENYKIVLELKSKPSWLTISEPANVDDLTVTLEPNQKLQLEYQVSAFTLESGTALASLSFGVLDGGQFPGCEGRDAVFDVFMRVKKQPELFKPGSIRNAGLSLMGVVILVAILCSVWVYRHRNRHVVRQMQPFFLIVICVGVSVLALSIIPLSYEDYIASPDGRDMACMATPWLLSMGFTVIMSSIFSKLARVNKIFLAPRFRRVKVGVREALAGFATLFAANFVLLLVWTMVDPLQWEVRRVDDNEDWRLYGSCTKMGTPGYVLLGLTCGMNFLILLLACYEAFKARGVSEEYSESKSLALALYSWVQIFIVGGPVMALMDGSNPNASYFLIIGLIVATCCSMLLLIFLPMILHLRKHGRRSSDILQRVDLISGITSTQLLNQSSAPSSSEAFKSKKASTQAGRRLPEQPQSDVECPSSSSEMFGGAASSSLSMRIPPIIEEEGHGGDNEPSNSPSENANESGIITETALEF